MGTHWSHEPATVAGYTAYLALVAEDMADDKGYQGRRLHCEKEISIESEVEWQRAVHRTSPQCGKRKW